MPVVLNTLFAGFGEKAMFSDEDDIKAYGRWPLRDANEFEVNRLENQWTSMTFIRLAKG